MAIGIPSHDRRNSRVEAGDAQDFSHDSFLGMDRAVGYSPGVGHVVRSRLMMACKDGALENETGGDPLVEYPAGSARNVRIYTILSRPLPTLGGGGIHRRGKQQGCP